MFSYCTRFTIIMPVWLKNLQQVVRINEHLLQFHCTFLLNAARAEKFDVSVACVDNREIRNLNRKYRNVNAPTDVLSFPYHEVRRINYCTSKFTQHPLFPDHDS